MSEDTWPKDIPLPTIEEAEEAVRLIEAATKQSIDDLTTEGASREALNTQITV